MSQGTVDFMYRTIALTIAGSVAVVMAYLGYVLVFVGDGTRDALVHALSLAIAAAVSSPVLLAGIHQLMSALTKAPPLSLPATVSVPAASVSVTVPASLSASAALAPAPAAEAAPAPAPASGGFVVPPSATPPAIGGSPA